MTDLEITKLCAEAMGWKTVYNALSEQSGGPVSLSWVKGTPPEMIAMRHYNPLHDRAQAMELVEKFRLQIDPHDEQWNVALPGIGVLAEDLLRAICLCVARMQAERMKS